MKEAFAKLALAVRAEAKRAKDPDARELITVLARLVEGGSLYDAFGAPGSWGYDSAMGSALSDLYRSGAPVRAISVLASALTKSEELFQ